MKPLYQSLSKGKGVDNASTSYCDSDLKSTSSSASSTSILTMNEQVPETGTPSLLKQQFCYLTLSILVILISTAFIVGLGTSSCHKPTTLAYSSRPLSLEKERQKALSMFPSPLKPPKNAKSCGPDSVTALSKGCHLDLISFTWLPHECYDPELTADFLSRAPWAYYHDPNGINLIKLEQLKSGEVDNGYVTWEYHLMHCLYTWKKLVRHLERGGPMDWYVMEFSHVRHCSDLLVEGMEKKKGQWNSEFFVQFPLCGYA